jgi:hypothetical protein
MHSAIEIGLDQQKMPRDAVGLARTLHEPVLQGCSIGASGVLWVWVIVYFRRAAHQTPHTSPAAPTRPWRTSTSRRTLPTGLSQARRSRRQRCPRRRWCPRRSARRASAPAASRRRKRRRSRRAAGTGERCACSVESGQGHVLTVQSAFVPAVKSILSSNAEDERKRKEARRKSLGARNFPE